MNILVRKGRIQDGESAIQVLRRSIQDLCFADHHGDADEIAEWLANKTVAAWSNWVARPDATLLVTESDGQITGVGMIDHKGNVLLNYVNPDVRFTGISKAILKALENIATEHTVEKCVVETTLTAKQFYIQAGYRPDAVNSLRLEKQLR